MGGGGGRASRAADRGLGQAPAAARAAAVRVAPMDVARRGGAGYDGCGSATRDERADRRPEGTWACGRKGAWPGSRVLLPCARGAGRSVTAFGGRVGPAQGGCF
eukprot:3263161-Prymnesium_polylepis.1